MIVIGISDLEENIGPLLRRVREQGEIVEVLDQGTIVARLVPGPRPPAPRTDVAVWADMERLAVEISAQWPAGVSALDSVHDVRRDL